MSQKIDPINTKKRISLRETYQILSSHVTEDHIFYLQVIIAIFIGLLTLYWLTRRVVRRVTGGRSVVLLGGCEAGKTTLLYTLSHGQGDGDGPLAPPVTVTSYKENVALYDTGKKQVRLVDVPGHERVRGVVFDRHKEDVRAVLFLLDSCTVHTHIRDVAEQLYGVLSDRAVQRSRCPVAVVCNKQDQELAKAAPVIERALQREIELLRESSRKQLASTSSTGYQSSAAAMVGVAGKQFLFTQLTSNPVTFIEASAVAPNQLNELRAWIDRVA